MDSCFLLKKVWIKRYINNNPLFSQEEKDKFRIPVSKYDVEYDSLLISFPNMMFVYSEKATQFEEIFHLVLPFWICLLNSTANSAHLNPNLAG